MVRVVSRRGVGCWLSVWHGGCCSVQVIRITGHCSRQRVCCKVEGSKTIACSSWGYGGCSVCSNPEVMARRVHWTGSGEWTRHGLGGPLTSAPIIYLRIPDSNISRSWFRSSGVPVCHCLPMHHFQRNALASQKISWSSYFMNALSQKEISLK